MGGSSKVSKGKSQLSSFSLLLTILMLLPGEVQSAEIKTSSLVYSEGEPIIVEFSEAPGNTQDWITTVPVGSPDTYNINGQFLRGSRSGVLQFPALRPGVYEARMVSRTAGGPVARTKFSVGQSCYNPAAVGERICDPALGNRKDQYAVGEPIEIFYEGVPGPNGDWITIVPAGSPDGQRTEWYQVKTTGSQIFKGQSAGKYEARLHLLFSGNTPAARFPFEVGDFTSSVAALPDSQPTGNARSLARPVASASVQADKTESSPAITSIDELPAAGIDGHWLGYLSCEAPRAGMNPSQVPMLFTLAGGEQPTGDLFLLSGSVQGLSLRVSGTFDGSGNLTLRPTEWIYPPRYNEQPVSLEATLEENGLRFTGTADGMPDCTSFEAYKFNPDRRPKADSGLIPLFEQYGQAAVNQENCINFLQFASQESYSDTLGEEVPSNLIDADTFYSMMGVTYDSWTYEYNQAQSRFWSWCVRLVQAERTDIDLQQLASKAVNNRRLYLFLQDSPPDGKTAARNSRHHLRYLTKYAALTGLRIAHLYADLSVEEARSMSSSRENLTLVLNSMDGIDTGSGPFTALPGNDRKQYVGSLLAERLRISKALMDEAFSVFNVQSYGENLAGLVTARTEEAAIVRDAKNYATPEQVLELEASFAVSFQPLSEAVAEQLLSAIPEPSDLPDSLIEGRAHLEATTRDALPYLASTDTQRVRRAYDDRNVKAAEMIAPGFSEWLDAKIEKTEEGRKKLTSLSTGMLGSSLEELESNSFPGSYRQLATAIQRREEKLRFEICNLPPGFESFRSNLCTQEAMHQIFEG